MKFKHARLPNGLEIVAETTADTRSTAVGFFIRVGARDEPRELNGISYFLQMMVFKGSERRTALDVNGEFDAIGARFNAFTSEDNTVFWGAVPREYLPRLVALYADILRPALRDEDVDIERRVIHESIDMYGNQPQWRGYECAMRTFYGGHPLGQPVLGTVASVGGIKPDHLRAHYNRHYVAGNILVVGVGNLDWSQFYDQIAHLCGSWPTGSCTRDTRPVHPRGGLHAVVDGKMNREHLFLLTLAPSAESDDRFAADVLATVVGDGTGSRLYWALIDTHFAETAQLDYHDFNGTGTFMTYLACDPATTADNLGRAQAIYSQVMADNLRDCELQGVKSKAASRIAVRNDRPMGRLMPLGFNWLYRHDYRSIDDDLAALARVSRDDLACVLAEYPLNAMTTVGLGPLTELRVGQCSSPLDADYFARLERYVNGKGACTVFEGIPPTNENQRRQEVSRNYDPDMFFREGLEALYGAARQGDEPHGSDNR